MKKIWLDYIVNITLIFAFIICGLTGILKLPLLFPYLRNVDFRFISVVHDWSGIIIVVLVAIHLVLHWKWILVMTKRLLKKKC